MSKTKWILTSVFAAILLLVPAVVLANELRTPVANIQDPQTVQLNADTIFDLVNQERSKKGIQPLVRDARLDATAQARVDDMVARNYYGHYDPKTGDNLVNVHVAYPGMCSLASENLMNGWPVSAGVVSGWMNSQSHKDAMLDSRYTISGIALSGKIVVQHFCIAK